MNEIDKEKLQHFSNSVMSDGMILRDIIIKKEIDLNDLFPILGPVSVIQEILLDKRKLKPSQILQLANHFKINSEVFSSIKESETSFNEFSESPESSSSAESFQENHMGESFSNEESIDDSDSEDTLKSMWE